MAPGHSAAELLASVPVVRAAQLPAARGDGSWRFDNLVGVLAEISEVAAQGAVSFVAEIVADAQDHAEPVAWIAGTGSIFFPPDMRDLGVDLAAVAVVRAGGTAESLVAAEWLARSGSFGLLVVDLDEEAKANDAWLGRLLKLAERSQCAVVFLTRKRPEDPSLGSRISLRGCVSGSAATPFRVEVRTVRDKRAKAGARLARQYRGPSGMR